ncbi:LpqB family beta-propeller domain-containing protein [Klenkia terrae]|uniref:LpqB family beta-propeller domain-containing protein n=1 Tax=Klenkia terrae TaxID=1052259 RepID=UPI00360966F1
MAPVLPAGSFTDPTTAATRAEVWTVRDGSEVIRVPATGTPQTVSAPTLPEQGAARVFQLSPDGVRAAVVVDGPDGGELLVGTVVRSDDQVAVRDLRSVAPELSQVVDVAWRAASELVVLAGAQDEDGTAPYSVGVDGWDLTTLSRSGLPAQPTAVAAAPSRTPWWSPAARCGSSCRAPGRPWCAARSRWAAAPPSTPLSPRRASSSTARGPVHRGRGGPAAGRPGCRLGRCCPGCSNRWSTSSCPGCAPAAGTRAA